MLQHAARKGGAGTDDSGRGVQTEGLHYCPPPSTLRRRESQRAHEDHSDAEWRHRREEEHRHSHQQDHPDRGERRPAGGEEQRTRDVSTTGVHTHICIHYNNSFINWQAGELHVHICIKQTDVMRWGNTNLLFITFTINEWGICRTVICLQKKGRLTWQNWYWFLVVEM